MLDIRLKHISIGDTVAWGSRCGVKYGVVTMVHEAHAKDQWIKIHVRGGLERRTTLRRGTRVLVVNLTPAQTIGVAS